MLRAKSSLVSQEACFARGCFSEVGEGSSPDNAKGRFRGEFKTLTVARMGQLQSYYFANKSVCSSLMSKLRIGTSDATSADYYSR